MGKLASRNDHKPGDSGMLACTIRVLLVQLPLVHTAKVRFPLVPSHQSISE